LTTFPPNRGDLSVTAVVLSPGPDGVKSAKVEEFLPRPVKLRKNLAGTLARAQAPPDGAL
jgi:hypothetical protein